MPRMTPADLAKGGESGGKVWCRWVVRAQQSEPRPPKHGLVGRERQSLFLPRNREKSRRWRRSMHGAATVHIQANELPPSALTCSFTVSRSANRTVTI